MLRPAEDRRLIEIRPRKTNKTWSPGGRGPGPRGHTVYSSMGHTDIVPGDDVWASVFFDGSVCFGHYSSECGNK